MIRFNHFNFNVLNLEKSKAFYAEALGLREVRHKEGEGFTLIFLGDGETDFSLELTEMHGRTKPYDLGEGEFHLAFVTDDFEALHKKHQKMGCVCFENQAMGIYFIADPDGYWIEIVPQGE